MGHMATDCSTPERPRTFDESNKNKKRRQSNRTVQGKSSSQRGTVGITRNINTYRKKNETRSTHISVDSDASEHAFSDESMLQCIEEIDSVQTELDKETVATAQNKFLQHVHLTRTFLILATICLVPSLRLTLLSFNHMNEHGLKIMFRNDWCILLKRNKNNELFRTIQERKSDGLYATEIIIPKKNRNKPAPLSKKLQKEAKTA